MAPASSSALRDESAADGLGYGSLTGIGGPKKFKKKPVLVLDPEELEAAHALFQEASAELCGEEVERPARPATVLGLAPMLDDDPEEMGASDEEGAEDDDTPVDTEAVLSLTRRRSNAMPIDEYFGDDLDDEEIYGASAPGLGGTGDESPLSDAEIDDGLDLSKRIFPSLKLAPGDEVPTQDFSPAGDAGDGDHEPDRATGHEPREAEPFPETCEEPEKAEPPVTDEHSPDEGTPVDVPQIPLDAKLMDYQDFGPDAVDDEHFEEAEKTPAESPSLSEEGRGSDTPRPARFDELNPDRPADDEEVFDLDAWLAEEQAEPVIVERPYTYEPAEPVARPEPSMQSAPEVETSDRDGETQPEEPSMPVEREEGPAEDGTRYTVTEDDDFEVDGYAFMRDEKRSRPMPVHSQQAGQQNSLRARLAREASRAESNIREIAEPLEHPSFLVRAWTWLKNLFN